MRTYNPDFVRSNPSSIDNISDDWQKYLSLYVFRPDVNIFTSHAVGQDRNKFDEAMKQTHMLDVLLKINSFWYM